MQLPVVQCSYMYVAIKVQGYFDSVGIPTCTSTSRSYVGRPTTYYVVATYLGTVVEYYSLEYLLVHVHVLVPIMATERKKDSFILQFSDFSMKTNQNAHILLRNDHSCGNDILSERSKEPR